MRLKTWCVFGLVLLGSCDHAGPEASGPAAEGEVPAALALA